MQKGTLRSREEQDLVSGPTPSQCGSGWLGQERGHRTPVPTTLEEGEEEGEKGGRRHSEIRSRWEHRYEVWGLEEGSGGAMSRGVKHAHPQAPRPFSDCSHAHPTTPGHPTGPADLGPVPKRYLPPNPVSACVVSATLHGPRQSVGIPQGPVSPSLPSVSPSTRSGDPTSRKPLYSEHAASPQPLPQGWGRASRHKRLGKLCRGQS